MPIPDFDDALIPEALGILGFDLDVVPSLSDGADGADDEKVKAGGKDREGEEGDQSKKRRTAGTTGGSGQREAQRRYRERKKEHTKELEKRVETLQARLDELESASAHPDKNNNNNNQRGGDGSELSSSTAEDASLQLFAEGVEQLKVLMERGASDSDMRAHLSSMCGELRTTLLTTASNYSRATMHRHAHILNEAKKEGDAADAGTGEFATSGSVCVGLLKTNVPSANSEDMEVSWTVSCEDASKHWSAVAERVEDVVPPSELNKLIEWRNRYVTRLGDIYRRRQELGLRLAFLGPTRPRGGGGAVGGEGEGVSVGLLGDEARDTIPAASGHHRGTMPNFPSSTNPTVPMEGKGQPAAAAPHLALAPGLDSFESSGSLYSETLSIIDALKLSVAEELEFKYRGSAELIEGAVQPRTCAHIVMLSAPMLPDPLAVTLEISRRRQRRTRQ